MLLTVFHIAAHWMLLGDTNSFNPSPLLPSIEDTVFIQADRIDFASVGRKQQCITIHSRTESMSQVLSENAQFFKEYGISGSATISKRGADATQTQVLWNGLPINHPMLGMMDFNANSAFGMDELRIIEGGNSAMYGSGSVGGTIMLQNHVKYQSALQGNLLSSFNNMDNMLHAFSLSKGWEHTYLGISYSQMQRNNRFEFFDPVWQRENSSVNSHHYLQNIRTVIAQHWRRSQLKAVFELGSVDRGLGFVYGSTNPLGQQLDRTTRALIQYDYQGNSRKFSQKLGYTSDQITFIPDAKTQDTSRASMYFFQSEWYEQTKIGRILIGIDYQIQLGKTKYYTVDAIRHLPAAFLALRSNLGKSTLLWNTRYEFHEQQWTGGFSTHTTLLPKLTIKTDFHRSFRRPTLNDLYWTASGINSLVPEIGWSGEVGLLWQQDIHKHSRVELEITPYHRRVQNPLVWLPDGARWSAQNLEEGRYWGVQFHHSWSIKYQQHLWKLNHETEWVYAQVKNQEFTHWYHPIFVPDLMVSTQLHWQYQQWNSSITWNLTGNRFTATDNSELLPLYSLWRWSIGRKHQLSLWSFSNLIQWQLVFHNVTNTLYENIPGRPMPPRNIEIKLNVHF